MITITERGLSEVIDRLQKAMLAMDDKRELHRRLGREILNWVDENFRREGALQGKPWRKLSPNTLIKKRGSGILQDEGRLRESFHMTIGGNEVAVGTADPLAPHHQYGTRSYTIRPKSKKFLKFQTVGGTVLAKQVRHPGLPARPMLPTEEMVKPRLIKVVEQWLRDTKVI
jgi:phage virion morphogenesis protein